ncbi:SDR family NAD(P)-dependent oxidoreductase [Rhodococcus jostii]|uniref:SDR family NAD(P)-dependent oxidoreductase n=1 Tax=Rhodococcus jostii TaxID=132919 RepID=UPI001ED8D0EC|nr:SDR family NAD(P)-dependent oxidoreductase [Rhodococcus jostii]
MTGASRGIGADTAHLLAARGASVVCAARTLTEGDNPLAGSLEQTVAAIQEQGGTAHPVVVNLAKDEDCRSLIEATRSVYGPVDILVNNAAVGFFDLVESMPSKQWLLSWRVMCHATFLLSQLALQDMLPRGSGRIVNVTSESAIGPGRGPYADGDRIGDTLYGANKVSVERFTQGLAEEVYGRGVGVAALAPSQLVPTPGAVFNDLVRGAKDPRAESTEFMTRAIEILLTAPLEEISGRVVYSQQLLVEYGVLGEGRGYGLDAQLPISGFAAR